MSTRFNSNLTNDEYTKALESITDMGFCLTKNCELERQTGSIANCDTVKVYEVFASNEPLGERNIIVHFKHERISESGSWYSDINMSVTKCLTLDDFMTQFGRNKRR